MEKLRDTKTNSAFIVQMKNTFLAMVDVTDGASWHGSCIETSKNIAHTDQRSPPGKILQKKNVAFRQTPQKKVIKTKSERLKERLAVQRNQPKSEDKQSGQAYVHGIP